jgi:uncharacterized membrane protein SpoIIM required for sporulation
MAPPGEASAATARFEELLDRCERARIHALAFEELVELGRLHRRHLALLARLRARGLDGTAIAHVNALCLRAHTLLYVPERRAPSPATFVREAIPAAFARTWHAIVLAGLLLAGGMLVGAGLAMRDPSAMRVLVPRCMCESPDRMDRLVRSPQARAEFLERKPTAATTNVAFGSMLFTHNTRVGLLAFATGILAGVPSVLLQLYNGIIVGAFAAIFFRDPWPLDFLAWILPHGIPELTAITLCAAGGLVLGGAMAAPGRRSRGVAVREAVGPALALVGTAVPLLLVAALTESFVRESTLGTATRLAIAGGYAVALLEGLAWIRRLAHRTGADVAWLADLMPRLAASPDTRSAPVP